MSFLDCLNKSQISKAKKKEAEDVYRLQYDSYLKDGIPEKDADFKAAQDTANALEVQKAADKKRKIKTIQAQQAIAEKIDSYKGSPSDAALAIFEKTGSDTGKARFASIVDREKVIKGSAHAKMNEFLNKFQPQYAGIVRPKAGLYDVVREMFGQSSKNDSAKELAGGVTEALEMLRKRANRAGANIGKRENYGMPQRHDRVKIAKTSREEWSQFIEGKLDWEKMVDPNTGLSIPPMRRQAVLKDVYDTIITDGYSKLKPNEMRRIGALDKRLANHRFLEFKTPDNWIEYHDQFGVGTPYDVVIGHIDKMSRDIALMEILGPNPNIGKEAIKNIISMRSADMDIKQKGKRKKLETQKVGNTVNKLDELYAVYANTGGINAENAPALTLAGTRNILTSAYLGSASLMAIPGDLFTKALTRKFNNIPASKDISKYMKMMNPLNSADRQIAVRSGLIAESATSIAYGQQRFLGEVTGPQWTQRVTDVVMRASLMTPHTQSARWSFGMEMMGVFADFANKPFKDLPFRKVMENYNISAADWDEFTKTPIRDERGAKFLSPEDARIRTDLNEEQAQELSDKFMEMIYAEMEYAVPSSSLRGRAFLTSDTRAGTFIGEIARSFAMFKNFPVTIINTHIARGLSQTGFKNKFKYMTAFGVGMTMMGALGLQMRQVANGNDPLSMNPASENGRKFWGNASLAGGGLAIWGDFLFSDVNRYGGGLEQTIAGPVFGLINDTNNLTTGNLMELIQGKETKFLPELINYLRRNLPASNLWYTKLLLQREVYDQLLLATDPEAPKKFRNMQRRAIKDRGQEFFWPAGESLIQGDDIRPPDFEAVTSD